MATKLVESCDMENMHNQPYAWEFGDMKASGEKYFGAQYEDELCSLTTAAPSPALTASQGYPDHYPSWCTQDFESFENFVLTDEDGMMLGGMGEASMEFNEFNLTCTEQEGGVMFPEELFQDDFGPQAAMWSEECALGSFAPVACEEETYEHPSSSCHHSGISLAGHAATGEWAVRTAPRPPAEIVSAPPGLDLPLVVTLGGAPDGSALLEAATGRGGFEDLPKRLNCF